MKSILDYETVALLDEQDAIEIIDQTKLPGTTELILLKTGEEIWNAIYLLQVRGAPAIGVTAGFGIYLLMTIFLPFNLFRSAQCFGIMSSTIVE